MSSRATHSLTRPTSMLGRYEVLCELGSGGMGVVYLGRLRGVGGFEKLVAIKVLHRHLASHPMIVDMLHTEARLAALIHHPNVVGMLDAGESDGGEHYVVMELVDGFTLGDVIKRLERDPARRMRIGLRIVLDAAAGLEAAHRLRAPSDGKPLHLVHRDVSTENVLVSVEGIGRISDFGVAHVAWRRRGSLPGVKGTPCYMAPEQARGAEHIDARADVFSLGAVLWEVLTGKQLFDSPSGVVGVIERVVRGEIAAPSGESELVPAALDEVCLKALQREPELRYQSARELAADLERVARQHHILASRVDVRRAIGKLFADAIAQRRSAIAHATERQSGEQPTFTGAYAAAALGLHGSRRALASDASADRSGLRALAVDPDATLVTPRTTAVLVGMRSPDSEDAMETPKIAKPSRRRHASWLLASALALCGIAALAWPRPSPRAAGAHASEPAALAHTPRPAVQAPAAAPSGIELDLSVPEDSARSLEAATEPTLPAPITEPAPKRKALRARDEPPRTARKAVRAGPVERRVSSTERAEARVSEALVERRDELREPVSPRPAVERVAPRLEANPYLLHR